MESGLVQGAALLSGAARAQELFAQNLANAATPGYRRQLVRYESFEARLRELAGGPSMVPGSLPAIDFSQGPANPTGSPTDFALDGAGFFVVQTPDGPRYTRAGAFTMDGTGRLVTSDGFPVLGESGPVAIRGQVEGLTVSATGVVNAGGRRIDRLRVVGFSDTRMLEPAGATLFRAREGAVEEASGARVRQGFREGSNVSPVEELAVMLVNLRLHEAATQALEVTRRAGERLTA
jgi:flagellar basal-body rod protein FlgF